MSPLLPNEKAEITKAKRTLNGFAAALFIEYAFMTLVGIVGGILGVLLDRADETTAILSSAYADTALRILGVIPIWLYARYRLPSNSHAPIHRIETPMPLILAASCLASFLARIPGAYLFGNDANIDLGMTYEGAELWVFVLSTSVLAPVIEEYMFRSVLLRAMRPFGRNAYLLVSSLLFASLHAAGSMLSAFVIALIFGYVAYETDSIRCTVMLHMVFNYISCMLMLSSMSENRSLYAALTLAYLVFVFVGGTIGVAIGIRNLKRNRRLSVRWLPVRYGFTVPIVLFLAYQALLKIVTILCGGMLSV